MIAKVSIPKAEAGPADRAARRVESSEAGYVLIAVIFMVALVVLSLAIAAPKVAAAIQRDRELELVHRGEQYKRAIRLYYKKFGSYPSSIDQLEKTNNIRFLRKRYLDPLTGKDDWKMILVGQAHVCPLGFFGQPLGSGQALAGATPIASMPNSTLGAGIGGNTSFGGSSSGFGSSSTGSGFGSSSSTNTSAAGTSTGTGCGSTGTGAVGLNGPGSDSSATSGSTGSSSGGFGNSAGGSTGGFGAGTSTSTTLGGGNTNNNGFGAATSSTLGGAPIMGVEPPLSKATILQYKLKTKYNEWEFAYWPAEDQAGAGGSLLGGSGSMNGTGNSVNGPGGSGTSGFGSSGNTSGFGSVGGAFGSSGGSGSGSAGSGGSGNPGQTPQ